MDAAFAVACEIPAAVAVAPAVACSVAAVRMSATCAAALAWS